MPESMPRQSRATKHFGPLRDHCRLEPIPITLWDRPVSECVRTRSPTHSNGPIGDASRPMIESSCEIRRESQKKLDSAATVPRIAKQLLTGLPLKLIHTLSPQAFVQSHPWWVRLYAVIAEPRPRSTHGARAASNGAVRRPRIARTGSEQARWRAVGSYAPLASPPTHTCTGRAVRIPPSPSLAICALRKFPEACFPADLPFRRPRRFQGRLPPLPTLLLSFGLTGRNGALQVSNLGARSYRRR